MDKSVFRCGVVFLDRVLAVLNPALTFPSAPPTPRLPSGSLLRSASHLLGNSNHVIISMTATVSGALLWSGTELSTIHAFSLEQSSRTSHEEGLLSVFLLQLKKLSLAKTASKWWGPVGNRSMWLPAHQRFAYRLLTTLLYCLS